MNADEDAGPPRAVLMSILRHAPAFLGHVTFDGQFLFLNQFVEGIGPDDIRGKSIFDFADPRHHDIIRQTFAQVVATGLQQEYETVAAGPNHQPARYLTRVAPVIEAGEVSSLVVIATDVTRLREAETARADSELALQHILATTGMGTFWWDFEQNVGGHDAVTAALFGLDPTAAEPDEVFARIHPDDLPRVRAALAEARETGVYQMYEHRILRTDGTTRWVSASGQFLGETRARLVGGLLDITNRKQLEAQYAQAQKLESVGRLAGGIAHDFNNMLTVILSYAELAERGLPAGSRVAPDLQQIRKAAERSVALTSQLLAFARQQVIEPRVVDLNATVRDVDRLLQRILGADIEVITALEATSHVRVDPNQFEQVIVNLATNARDAMPHGGRLTIETRDVDVTAGATADRFEVGPGSYVLLAISDSGVGIAKQHLAQIFEPFFTTKEQGKGTGLGLAMVYGVVRQNHGYVLVETEEGLGTSFKIYLPRVGGQLEAAISPPAVVASGGHETILFAEDEVVVRDLVVRALESAGYRVLATTDGMTALEIARGHAGPIDLLLTDVVMPKLGGKQLAEQLVAERPELHVLYISGYSDDAVIHDGVVDAGVALLEKPFTPSTLLARVRQALARPTR